MPTIAQATAATELLVRFSLVNTCEQDRCLELLNPAHEFSKAISHCESLHIHIKVNDTEALPKDELVAAGCVLDYEKTGFVKYLFPGGMNLIFSSIDIAEDDLIENQSNRRRRPFVDHFGIDLRSETEEVRGAFDEIPGISSDLGWDEVPQGTDGSGVHCCHVEVGEKHWVFPSGEAPQPLIPLEFAFGELKINDLEGGCDLRPMSPTRRARLGDSAPACGG